MANKKLEGAFWMNGLRVYGKTKILLLLSIVVSVFALIFAGCRSAPPPPMRPALSQTVITVQRGNTKLEKDKLFVYVDDRCINPDNPIGKGQFISYPVNNGVHYIHAVAGKLTSEAINFSAASQTVPFIVETVEQKGRPKTKLVVSRSVTVDDTGRETDLDIQESYGDL